MTRTLLPLLALSALIALALMVGVNLDSQIYSPKVCTAADKSPTIIWDSGLDQDSVGIYWEDFESDSPATGNWSMEDLTSATWHKDQFMAYSGQSWWAGDTLLQGYDDFTLQYLRSPVLDLTTAVNPVLEFQARWAVEPAAGAPIPYDGMDGVNVWASNDDGNTWNPLPINDPFEYTSSHLGSFGHTWGSLGFGNNVPGWTGFSYNQGPPGSWIHATANMSAYNSAAVRFRFALASDESLATRENPALTGFFVDNIFLHGAAGDTLLYNDADAILYPRDMQAVAGMETAGNFWHLEYLAPGSAPSGDSVMRFSEEGTNGYPGGVFIKNALVSPRINLEDYSADSFRIECDFQLRGSLNVGDPADSLPDIDFWTIQVSPDSGIHWYYFSNPWGVGASNVKFAAIPDYFQAFRVWWGEAVDLTPYAGGTVSIRILFQTDGDNYVGEGMFMDNFSVDAYAFGQHDVSAQNLWFPMPTSAYFDTLLATVDVHNQGISSEDSIPVFWKNGNNPAIQLLPAPALPSSGMSTMNIALVNPTPGTMETVVAYTDLEADTTTANDTSYAGTIEITPADLLEFGYDNRQYSYLTNWFYTSLYPDSGIAVRFTPSADRVTAPLSALEVRALFQTTGPVQVHVLEAGTPTTPGPQAAEFQANVTNIYPAWQSFDLSGVSYLQNSNTDFWIWLEGVSGLTHPRLRASQEIHGAGHFFSYTGTQAIVSNFEFFVRVRMAPGTSAVEPNPSRLPDQFTLGQNRPNPFNPTTTIPYTLAHAAQVKVTVYDVNGRLVATLVQGQQPAGAHQATFEGKGLTSGVYLYRLQADEFTASGKMVLLK